MVSGFAKSLFTEIHKRLPEQIKDVFDSTRFPFLHRLSDQKLCAYSDYLLTLRLLQPYSEVSEDVALFLCHIVMAAREGHLCVKFISGEPVPSVRQIWRQDDKFVLSGREIKELTSRILFGSTCIPPGLITALPGNSLQADVYTPLCRSENTYYLQRHWIYETEFLQYYFRHAKTSPAYLLDQESVKRSVEGLLHKGVLLKEQARALQNTSLHPISIITGGPGTGKSYTAALIIKLFSENMDPETKRNFSIVMAAPTGKAVAGLRKNLGQLIGAPEGFLHVKIMTLHALLGVRSRHSVISDIPSRLTADLIIVDESSMIDMHVMARLFDALKCGSRLVLLGDCRQLPAVEAGSVFADLIDVSYSRKETKIPCTELKVCLRAELQSIVDFASIVDRGMADQVLAGLQLGQFQGIRRIGSHADTKSDRREFLKQVLPSFPGPMRREGDPEEMLRIFQTVRILSPMRKGLFGVEELNSAIQEFFIDKAVREGWLAVPIMIAVNDYRKDLFNGETGTLMRRTPLRDFHPEDYAVFPSRIAGEGVRKIPAALLPAYEYAYCLSVHKSQGSEFDRIILVLPEGSEVFGREVFYTAVTRARKQIDICGSDETIQKTVLQKGSRISGIVDRVEAIVAR